MATFTDLFTDAFTQIRVARAGDVMNGEDAAYLLLVFNRILDAWNANRRAVYNETFTDFTLTPNHTPHTIGAGGDFNLTQRPVNLSYAAVNLGGAPAVFVPVRVRDDAWYQRQPVPSLTNSFPTDVYYSPDWPLGNLYFWGVPTVAYGVRLWMRTLLAQVTDPTLAFSLPPGYQDALTKTLAEEIAPGFGQPRPDPEIARAARDLIFDANDPTPSIATADAGLGGSHSGGGFNWMNRSSS